MTRLLRKARWWLQRRRKEAELREELQFHLAEEIDERRAEGVSVEDAAWAARRDLGNVTLLREDARTLWTWTPIEQLAQDARDGFRGLIRNRTFTALAGLSLALGIGANTAIYSFMEAILLRSLPVADPASLVALQWRSPAVNASRRGEFVLHAIDGETYDDGGGLRAAIFPYPAFELLQQASHPVLSSLFAHKAAGRVNVMRQGEAELAQGEYVSGEFFRGLAVVPDAGRLIHPEDDRAGAPPVAVLSAGYSEGRFGGSRTVVGQPILINGVPFTVIGVAPREFLGVDPSRAPQVYLPMHASAVLEPDGGRPFDDPHYYWVEMMGRLKPGIDLVHAQSALAAPFAEWVASTATTDRERANLPTLQLTAGAGGLDSLRRQYSKPLYVLLAMVALILAIACANTANLLLARSAARSREIAVRLSVGASRWRVVRQLLTESVLLAMLSGIVGIAIAFLSMQVLTSLLANGQESLALHVELNRHVLLFTLLLSMLSGLLFGFAPALQATRPANAALMTRLRDRSVGGWSSRLRSARPTATQVLVVAQIATSLVLLVAAGLFVRTLANLQRVPLGFNPDHVLLFEVNAPQAGYPQARVADLYAELRRRLLALPNVRDVTLSHASLIRAGRGHPITIDGQPTPRTRVLWTGPQFFETMQIPIVRGRGINENDRQGRPPVVVVSDLFATTNFGEVDPIGRRIAIGGSLAAGGSPLVLEIIGIAAPVRYGGLKVQVPPVVYVPYAQIPTTQVQEMTFALRTGGDPVALASAVRRVVHEADARVPVTNLKTQTADIEETINQEIVFARLCTAFAILALTIACVGLYATMAYAVTRRTAEIGLRLALGAGPRAVIWMILRDVCVLAAIGLSLGAAVALAGARWIESFLFEIKPTDPGALVLAVGILLASAMVAGFGPACSASRVDPLAALRHD